MCYGSLDPKFGLRDLEKEVKSLSWSAVPEKETATGVRGGAMALARAIWLLFRRKDIRRV
jgi:hypothetical protein